MEQECTPLIPSGTAGADIEKPVTVTLENGEIIELIPNPLPVPKKRKRLGMEFPFEVTEDKAEFDHEIPEDKMCFDVD